MDGSSHPSIHTNTTTTTSPDAGCTRCTTGDMAWEWGVWKDPNKRSNIWCTLCDKKICGGITRLKQHLKTGLSDAIDRLVPDEAENDKLRVELNHYIDSLGQFGSQAAIRSRAKVAPHTWWRSYGFNTPLLQKFAMTVLSQTCSASPCERNWSAFDNLHSKKRNCLLQQKLNDLVFIQYNTRLKRRFNSLKTDKSLDPILLRDVEGNDDWTIPNEVELQEFVDASDDLLWSNVQEAMGGNEPAGPSTRSKRERYRDDDDIVDEEDDIEDMNDLDGVDSDAELFNYD